MKLNVMKYGPIVPVPREALLAAGIVEPTPQERTDAERRAADAEAAYEAHAAARTAARTRLAEITDQPARAVLDLHAEDEHGQCGGCDFEGYEAWEPIWPCGTVDVIAKHYGIKPEDL